MANYLYDILRVEAGTTGVSGLPTILRNKMIGFENDYLKRLAYKDSAGVMHYWSEDGSTGLMLASNVIYNQASLSITDAGSALDYLFRQPIVVNTFTNTAISSIKGETVNGFTASWGVTGTFSTLELGRQGDTGLPGLVTDTTAYGYTGCNYGPTGSYYLNLKVTNPWESSTSNSYVYFKINKYYGQSASATPDETIIEAGTAVLSVDTSSTKTQASTSIAGGGNYVYYAYPAAWGLLSSLNINGFSSTWNITTVSVTNGSGNTENYYCYTSPNTLGGTITLAAS